MSNNNPTDNDILKAAMGDLDDNVNIAHSQNAGSSSKVNSYQQYRQNSVDTSLHTKFYFYNANNQICYDSSAVKYAVIKYDNNGNTVDQQWGDIDDKMTVGRTPSGGAFTISSFYDENDQPCPRQFAVRYIDKEYDDSGNLINETQGNVSRVIDHQDSGDGKQSDWKNRMNSARNSIKNSRSSAKKQPPANTNGNIRYLISLFLFWLKGEISFEQNFIRFKTPNTIMGIIPLGAKKESMPINQLSVVSTSFSLDFKGLLVGIIITIVGIFVAFEDFPENWYLIFIAIFGAVMCLSAFETELTVEATSGKTIVVPFWIVEKRKAEEAEQRINDLISGRMDDTNGRQQADRIVDAIHGRY